MRKHRSLFWDQYVFLYVVSDVRVPIFNLNHFFKKTKRNPDVKKFSVIVLPRKRRDPNSNFRLDTSKVNRFTRNERFWPGPNRPASANKSLSTHLSKKIFGNELFRQINFTHLSLCFKVKVQGRPSCDVRKFWHANSIFSSFFF